MSPNPFECLTDARPARMEEMEEEIEMEIENSKTPENRDKRTYFPESPRKKLKAKRKATSPLPKELTPQKTATYYLSLAGKAIESAIKAEKEE